MRAGALLAVFLLSLGASSALAEDGPYLFDLLEQPAYQKAWNGMLAGETVPGWVKSVDGPSTPSKPVSVGGEPYTLAWLCKAHDCADNQLYVLFAPGARQAWALVIGPGNKRRWLGNPDAAVKAAIESGVQ